MIHYFRCIAFGALAGVAVALIGGVLIMLFGSDRMLSVGVSW